MSEYQRNPDSISVRLRFCITCGVALPRNRRAYCEDCRPAGHKWNGGIYAVAATAQRTSCQMCGRPLRGGTAPVGDGGLSQPALRRTEAASQSGRQVDGPTGTGTAAPTRDGDGGTMALRASSSPTGDGDGGTMALRASYVRDSASSSPTGDGDGLRFCTKCLPVYQETAGRIFAETGKVPRAEALLSSGEMERMRMRLSRRVQLSGDMIANVAQVYDVPYNSYGRLRAYIEECDQLPPDRFLKSHRKNPVVETVREME